MADQLQLRGGTTSEHSTFTGALREVTVDTDKDVLVVHDNSTAGGHPLMAEDGSNSALALGSAGTPSLKFTGDANTGIYSPTADTVGVSTGGTERIRIDSSGNVGLGTSSPGAVLDVSGSGNIVRLGDGTNTFDVRFQGTNNWAVQLDTSTDKFNIQRNSSPLVTVASSGAVGIGTTSPTGDLHIQSSAGSNVVIQSGGTSDARVDFIPGGETNPYYVYVNSSRNLIFTDHNTERARIDSSGRLLVGTSTASGGAFIQVVGRSGAATDNSQIRLGRGSSVAGADSTLGVLLFTDNTDNTGAYIYSQSDGSWTSGSSHPGRLVFSTTASGAAGPTERMRIHNGGQVTIGTTTVNGSGGLTISAGGVIVSPPTYSTTVGGTNRDLYVDNAGLIGYVSSNRASKKNIENLLDANWIYDLNPVSFNYRRKDEDGNYTDETYSELEYGLIAEEVEPIASDLCFYDELETGRELRGVHYSKLIAPLLKAVQDLKAENVELQARVAALESA